MDAPRRAAHRPPSPRVRGLRTLALEHDGERVEVRDAVHHGAAHDGAAQPDRVQVVPQPLAVGRDAVVHQRLRPRRDGRERAVVDEAARGVNAEEPPDRPDVHAARSAPVQSDALGRLTMAAHGAGGRDGPVEGATGAITSKRPPRVPGAAPALRLAPAA